MKKIVCFFGLVISLQLSQLAIAQTVNPTNVEVLFNFAEQTEPGLFAPAGAVTQSTEPGWLFRFYTDTQSYAAVHIGSGGEYQQGAVYVLGGPFGDTVTYIDSLDNLITLINNSNPGGGQSGIVNPGNGNCVVMNLPIEGTVFNSRSVSQQQGGQSVVDFTIEYLQVSNLHSVSKQTSMATFNGNQSTTVNDTTTNYQVEGDLRYITSIATVSTSTVQGLGSTSQSTELSYSPRIFNGPANTFCEEQEWLVAATSQTVTSSDPLPGEPSSITSNTEPFTTMVMSINESVTVPAGSFSTVRMEFSSDSFKSVVWADPETGLNIKTESYDEDNALTSTTELQSIN